MLGRLVAMGLQRLARSSETARAQARAALSAEDRAFVTATLDDDIARLRSLSYTELLELHEDEWHHEHLTMPGGEVLTRTVGVLWDVSEADRALRVVVDVFASGTTLAIGGFIRAPDGSFVGE